MVRIKPSRGNYGHYGAVSTEDDADGVGRGGEAGAHFACDPTGAEPTSTRVDLRPPHEGVGSGSRGITTPGPTTRGPGMLRRDAATPPHPASQSALSQPSGSACFKFSDDDAHALRAATALVVLVEQAFRRSTDRPDLMPHEFATLRYIAQLDEQGTTVAAVARTFNLTTPASVSLFKPLLDRNLISGEFPEGRRRGRRARLTNAGWQALQCDPLQCALAELFSHVSAEDNRAVFENLIRTSYAQARWHELSSGVELWR